ncbi:MAG: hypothetical protein ACI3XE_01205, partial [Eubacteriales bacterium]
MSRIGFLQDLVRGIRKILDSDRPAAPQATAPILSAEPTVSATAAVTDIPLIIRARLALESGDWNGAYTYCEQILDADPECGDAYFFELLATHRCKNENALIQSASPIDDEPNFHRAVRFSSEERKQTLMKYAAAISQRAKTVNAAQEGQAKQAHDKEKRNSIIWVTFLTVCAIAYFVALMVTQGNAGELPFTVRYTVRYIVSGCSAFVFDILYAIAVYRAYRKRKGKANNALRIALIILCILDFFALGMILIVRFLSLIAVTFLEVACAIFNSVVERKRKNKKSSVFWIVLLVLCVVKAFVVYLFPMVFR